MQVADIDVFDHTQRDPFFAPRSALGTGEIAAGQQQLQQQQQQQQHLRNTCMKNSGE